MSAEAARDPGRARRLAGETAPVAASQAEVAKVVEWVPAAERELRLLGEWAGATASTFPDSDTSQAEKELSLCKE